LTLHDLSAAEPLTQNYTITNYFSKLGGWEPPIEGDKSTHNQPYLLLCANPGGTLRYYMIWWDLQNAIAADPYFKSTGGLDEDDLPGWEDANGIYGLNTLWNGNKNNAPWLDEPDQPSYSMAWGDFIPDDWFTTDPADGSPIPG
jgi:hypothetical protein